jgi:hypothetical protein
MKFAVLLIGLGVVALELPAQASMHDLPDLKDVKTDPLEAVPYQGTTQTQGFELYSDLDEKCRTAQLQKEPTQDTDKSTHAQLTSLRAQSPELHDRVRARMLKHCPSFLDSTEKGLSQLGGAQ